ncbi:MAG: Lrp/AsnC family transcriptional regulator, partial [Promethearchaeota archaeon]
MKKKMFSLDEKDLNIIEHLENLGPRFPTRELSEILRIPSRTIRYRIKRLQDSGYLQPTQILTHERKLGLGENIIILQKSKEESTQIEQMLESHPYVYW